MQSKSFVQNLIKGIKGRLSGQRNGTKVLSWLDEKVLKHQTIGKTRTLQFRGKPIRFTSPPDLHHGLTEIFGEQVYQFTSNNPSPRILDCGSNIGLSILYFKTLFPNAKVTAFEPDPQNFRLLKENVTGWNMQDTELLEKAVWRENTVLRFASEGTMGSHIDTAGNAGISIDAVRLKDWLTEHIDFLKLDVEGAEYEVLKDAGDSLRNVENLFVEYHGTFQENGKLVELLELITQQGFLFYIKEATPLFAQPFMHAAHPAASPYEVQLNIFCFRN